MAAMNPGPHLEVDGEDRRRFDRLAARYRLLFEAPDRCRPMIHVVTPVPGLPSWEERLSDPLVMLRAELDSLRPHLEIRDDRAPTVRVQFGTGQVAAAFGCPLRVLPDSPPAAAGSALERAGDALRLAAPRADAGWYGKLMEWTAIWKERLPPGIRIQLPDIQSAFNSAHLIRGNGILTDFYDHPAEVGALLDRVTDFMIATVRRLRPLVDEEPGWFHDWGALWKGGARISNCSLQMISPAFYREHVLPRDIRFFDAVGGGRVHYCGLAGPVMEEFFRVPSITGLDVDAARHDFFALCDRAPARVVLAPTGPFRAESPEVARLLAGDWPRKRNWILSVWTASVEQGKILLDRLRASIPY